MPILEKHDNLGVHAGVGLDYGDSIEVNIENSPHTDKSLIVGNSISTSVKICSQVPFDHIDGNRYFIKASSGFLDNSDWGEKEIKWNAKKIMGFVKFIK